jgi:hypothetical protein
MGRPAVSCHVTTPVPGKTHNCRLLQAQELMSMATLCHRHHHQGQDRDPPHEQMLTAVVGGAVRVSSSLPSSSLPTPLSHCRSLSCFPLSLPILVPKKFVSEMKMKMRKERENILVAQEMSTTSLGPFFRSIPLVLIVSQSSVIVSSFFGCCCSLLLSFHAQSTPQAVTREAGCG